MELLNYLHEIPMPVLLIILALWVIFTIYLMIKLIKLKELDGIRKDVYKLFVNAESKYSSGEGLQKMKWVVSQARLLLPPWMQAFMSDETLLKIFQAWFLVVKDFLDDGIVNGSLSADAEK